MLMTYYWVKKKLTMMYPIIKKKKKKTRLKHKNTNTRLILKIVGARGAHVASLRR